MELVSGVFHLQGGSNMGLAVQDGEGLLIDADLDKEAAWRALRAASELEVTREAVLLTHAHADHFGGAYFLQRQLEVPLYGPALEGAMMENPIIEPLHLFGGAAPIGELRHKFTLARPCRVAHVVEPGSLEIGPFQVGVAPLPGHAPNQERLTTLPYARFAPGHGPAYEAGDEIAAACAANERPLEEI